MAIGTNQTKCTGSAHLLTHTANAFSDLMMIGFMSICQLHLKLIQLRLGGPIGEVPDQHSEMASQSTPCHLMGPLQLEPIHPGLARNISLPSHKRSSNSFKQIQRHDYMKLHTD